MEVRPRVAVLGVLRKTHGDRLDHLGQLIERDHRDLDKVVHGQASEELLDGSDLRLPPGIAFLLLALRPVERRVARESLRLLVEGEAVGLLDLALALAVRATRQVDVVVSGNGYLGGPGPVAGDVQQHEDVRVQAAGALVTGVKRLVDILRQRAAVLVDPAVEPHDEDVGGTVGGARAPQNVGPLDASRQADVLERAIPEQDEDDSGRDKQDGPTTTTTTITTAASPGAAATGHGQSDGVGTSGERRGHPAPCGGSRSPQ